MRERSLLVTGWLIAAAVIASAAVFAASAPDAGPVFDARCGRCHTRDDVAGRLAAVPADQRGAFVPALLERHFAPPAADRPALAQFLIDLGQQPRN